MPAVWRERSRSAPGTLIQRLHMVLFRSRSTVLQLLLPLGFLALIVWLGLLLSLGRV